MSDILIRGMEMPTSCYKCPVRQRNGMDLVCPIAHERFSVADVNILEYRLDNCPLVPVPAHGRLGDLDALYSHIKEEQKTCDSSYECWTECHVALGFVTGASTIIPASEEAET